MKERRETLRVVNESGIGLCVEFWWHDDRYAHTVSLQSGELLMRLLDSVEGSGLSGPPKSPPIQQLLRQPLDSGEAIFGVGMDGRSHWSMSVTAERKNNRVGLVFDNACRLGDDGWHPRSVYRVQRPATIYRIGDGTCQVEACGHNIRIDANGIDGTDPVEVKFNGSELCLIASSIRTQSTNTVRWRYEASIEYRSPKQDEPNRGL